LEEDGELESQAREGSICLANNPSTPV